MPRITPASQSIHSIWSRTAPREPLLNVRPPRPPITAQAKPGQISVPNPPVNHGVVTLCAYSVTPHLLTNFHPSRCARTHNSLGCCCRIPPVGSSRAAIEKVISSRSELLSVSQMPWRLACASPLVLPSESRLE